MPTPLNTNNIFGMFIVLGIFIIVGCIVYSYRKFDVVERFTSLTNYSDLVTVLNNMKTPLEAMRRSQTLDISYPSQPNVTNYIQPDDIRQVQTIKDVNSSFELDFSQKLQDADIKDLEAELNALLKKSEELNKANPVTPKTSIKHISGAKLPIYGGSASLSNPNDLNNFNVGYSGTTGYCLVNQPGMPVIESNGIREQNSIAKVQCNLADATQYFSARQINNNAELNKLLSVEKQIPAEYTLINYPFSVLTPNNGTGKECLSLNEDGLSVEPCNGSTDQRFQVITTSV